MLIVCLRQGRVGILKVHARGKKIEPGLDFDKVARATAGFTGAELMNLMNQSAITAVRAVRRARPAVPQRAFLSGPDPMRRMFVTMILRFIDCLLDSLHCECDGIKVA